MRIELLKKYYPLFMGFRFWRWEFTWHIRSIKLVDHKCLNQVMDGDYDCEYCNSTKDKDD